MACDAAEDLDLDLEEGEDLLVRRGRIRGPGVTTTAGPDPEAFDHWEQQDDEDGGRDE